MVWLCITFFVLGPAEILHVGYKDHLIRLKLNEIEIVETILKLVELLITYLIEFLDPRELSKVSASSFLFTHILMMPEA